MTLDDGGLTFIHSSRVLETFLKPLAGAFPGVCECFQQVPCVENSDTNNSEYDRFFPIEEDQHLMGFPYNSFFFFKDFLLGVNLIWVDIPPSI